MCKNLFIVSPVYGEVADANSGSLTASSYVSAIASMLGLIIG